MARTTPAQRTLASYRTEVRRLLHDATQKFWTNTELNDYINDARNRVCADTGCLRRLVSGYLIQNRESYPVGSVLGANIVSGGTGYLSPTITFSGGDPTVPAAATLTVTGGVITAITFTEYGEGYLEAPTATITDGDGEITNLFVTDLGIGYQSAPGVTIGGDGSGATGVVSLQLVGATFDIVGSGYASGDILTVLGGTFTRAAQIKVIIPGTAFQVIDGGDYQLLPGSNTTIGGIPATTNVSVSGGSGSGAQFSCFWGLGVGTVTAAGSGYTFDPPVTLSLTLGGAAMQAIATPVGGGTGAEIDVTVIPAGTIDVMNITPIWGNQRIPMRYMPFTEFNARLRTFFINPQRPCVWSRYGSSHLTVMVQPVPDQLYVTEFDTAILPLDLTTDDEVDEMSYPYTTPVAYYAAWKAKLKQQAYAEAEAYLKDYRQKILEAQASIQMRRIPNPYYGYSGA